MGYWKSHVINLTLFVILYGFFDLRDLPLVTKSSNVHIKADSAESVKIKKRLLEYSSERERLSINYLEKRHGIKKTRPTIDPKIIVVHYTNGGTIESIYRYFNSPTIENSREFNKKQSILNVSSHYLIDRDGSIYQIMEDSLFARHTIGLNYCAIGIENIGGPRAPLTKKQIEANARLIRRLVSLYKIEYVIGHSEYLSFKNSSWWKELDKNYFTIKQDPGEQAMKEIRLLINDLKLFSAPK